MTRLRLQHTLSLFVGCLALACGDSGVVGVDGDADVADANAPDGLSTDSSLPGLISLRVEPALVEIADDGFAPGETAAVRAIGTFDDGERDLTALVFWTVEREALATLDSGLVTSQGIGGRGVITAQAGEATASADLHIRVEVAVPGDVDPEVRALFPEDTSGDVVGVEDAPLIVYPSDETQFPRNLERVDHQWRAEGLDVFEVRFESELGLIRYFTSDLHLLPDAAGWRWIADTHAGASLELSVRGIDSEDPSRVLRSDAVTLYYSESEVRGALYYWSTGAQGVMRATIASTLATKFYSGPEDNTCVACHTVSRNGRRMSMGYGGEQLRQVSVPEAELQIPSDPDGRGRDYGWGTYNPEATRLLFSADGEFTMLDAESGDELEAPGLPEDWTVTHPDWSPDGAYIAFAYHDSESLGDKSAEGTGLARIPVRGDGTFGTAEVLLPSEDGEDDTLFFPAYSPDGRWLAFVRAEGKSKDAESATVFLLASDGAGAPVELMRLNERVRHQDGVVDVGNSMPRWAPSTQPGTFWLVFSSVRAYGDVIQDGGRDQLWGVAIDPAAIGASDPSYAAFWMPFQEVEEGNHRAFWTIDTDDVCDDVVEICDEIDNDCDGIVDEECCVPGPEVCGDMVDNDCDGLADEGCGCEDTETCDNGIDDDCDGATDGADEDCLI